MVRLHWLGTFSVAVTAHVGAHSLAASGSSHILKHESLVPLPEADSVEQHPRIMRSDAKLSEQASVGVRGDMILPAVSLQRMNGTIKGQQKLSIADYGVASDAAVNDSAPSTTDANLDFYGNCEWKDDDIDTFANKILIVSLCANLLSLSMIAVISLPLFGGKFVDKLIFKVPGDPENASRLYALASLVGIAGILTGLFPLAAVSPTCVRLGQEICDGCKASKHACSEVEAGEILKSCKEVGISGAYSVGFGWIAILTGVVAVGLSICACCRLFKLSPSAGLLASQQGAEPNNVQQGNQSSGTQKGKSGDTKGRGRGHRPRAAETETVAEDDEAY